MKKIIIIGCIIFTTKVFAFGWSFNFFPRPIVPVTWTWTAVATKSAIGGSGFYYIYLQLQNGTVINSHSCASTWSIVATGATTLVGGSCPYVMTGTAGTIGGCFSQGNIVSFSCVHN